MMSAESDDPEVADNDSSSEDSFGGDSTDSDALKAPNSASSTKSNRSLKGSRSGNSKSKRADGDSLNASNHGQPPSYNSMLAWNKKTLHESEHSNEGTSKSDETDEGGESADEPGEARRRPGRKKEMRRGASDRNLLRRSGSSRNVAKASSRRPSKGDDELSSSMHKGVSDRRTRRSSTGPSSAELATTVHGNEIPGYSRTSTRRPARAPSRTKSGDGAPPPSSRRSNRDELGAATLHGKSSVSRIRTKRRSSLTETTSKEKEKSKSKPDRRAMMKRAMSTTNVQMPDQVGPGGPGGDAPFASPTPRRGRRPQRQRRDLMDLFRDKKTITEKDITDKDNRQTLHRLMYEHKMGISLKSLARKVKKETRDGVVPPPPKPLLYVDA